MLQRTFRLPASIRLTKAHTLYSPYFVVKIASNGLSWSRFGFIVSKKVEKTAVGRNRLKRRFRAGIEKNLAKFPSGHDFLFLLKKEAIEQTTTVLHKEIEKVLSKFAR